MNDPEEFLNIPSTILVVDDNTKNLQIVGSILRESNYHIAVAKDGESALKLASKIKPDLILLDVMMPGMSGFDVCAKLKNNQELRDIPVIFLTAKTEVGDIVMGFTNGGVDYITKPFIKEELLARIRAHLILKRNEEKLKELIQTKDKFFSIIAHDLKSPVTTIMSLMELLFMNYDSYDDVKRKKLINASYESINMQYKLLENLLEWSRVQTGSLEVHKSNFDLNEVCLDSIEFSTTIASSKKIRLNIQSNENIEVFADKNMIATVIRNLLSNAIKFSNENSEIDLELIKNDTIAVVSLVDHGVGIPPDRLKNVFNLMSKSTMGTNNETGTGLGLILCKEFIEKNDGTINVESDVGKGTKVIITLPLD